MIIIRHNKEIEIGRSRKMMIVVMSINLEWKEDRQHWKISIKDYMQIPNTSTTPGSPLFLYEALPQEKGEEYEVKIRTAAQVDALFSQFGMNITPEDSFTDKFRKVIALSAIYENQVKPPYTINPADLEIVDTDLEVVPGAPDPEPIP